jgi:hypothetical protein
MIITEEEVEKAALEHIKDIHAMYHAVGCDCFIEGAKFVENKVQEYVVDIITENQGLKLYKDNEAKRFKELAVEFARHIRGNPKKVEDWNLTIFEEGKFVSDDVRHYDNIEELFETFIKERNEKN